jgi:hypothetical protein
MFKENIFLVLYSLESTRVKHTREKHSPKCGLGLVITENPSPLFWECPHPNTLGYMNIPLRKEEGSYTYSLRVGRKLCLVIGVRSLPLSRSRCKNLPSLFIVIKSVG